MPAGDDIIKARIVFDTKGLSGLAGAAPGGGGGGGRRTGFGGLIESFKKTGGIVGKIAAGVAGGMALFAGAKALIGKMVDSSPLLQASIQMLQKSLEFILRPIGDAIGFILKPFALLMMRWAISFYKNALPVIKEALESLGAQFAKPLVGAAAGGPGAAEEAIGTIGQLSENMVDAQYAMAEASAETGSFTEKMLALIPAAALESLIAIKDAFVALWNALVALGTFLFELLKPVLQLIAILGAFALLGALKLITFAFLGLQVLLQLLSALLLAAAEGMKEIWYWLGELVVYIAEHFIQGLKNLGAVLSYFFTEVIPAAWESMKQKIGLIIDSLKEKLIGAWESIKSKIVGIIESIKSKLSFGLGGKTTEEKATKVKDFILSGDRLIQTSPQDTLIGTKNPGALLNGGGAGPMNVTINISALDASSINSSVIGKISEALEKQHRRGILGRTIQATGV